MKYFNRSWFNDRITPIMEGIVDLHNHIFFYMVVVVFFVLTILIIIVYNFHLSYHEAKEENLAQRIFSFLQIRKLNHGTALEIIWTIIPAIILALIAIPSFVLIFVMDEVTLPRLVVKVIGNQWYWDYEYSKRKYITMYEDRCEITKLSGNKFSSYLVPEKELKTGEFRLLEVDNALILPVDTHIQLLITSNDVIHSWAIPRLGVKVDAVPGRLNMINFYINRPGTIYGQCREICGIDHGFMPITVKAYN